MTKLYGRKKTERNGNNTERRTYYNIFPRGACRQDLSLVTWESARQPGRTQQTNPGRSDRQLAAISTTTVKKHLTRYVRACVSVGFVQHRGLTVEQQATTD